MSDHLCALTWQGYLEGRDPHTPFLCDIGLMNPHDIGGLAKLLTFGTVDPGDLPEDLPELPPNFRYDVDGNEAGESFRRMREGNIHKQLVRDWTEEEWRYYIWMYYRYTEMVDRDVGRIVEALEHSPYRDNTLVVFSADHGESLGRHRLIAKSNFYKAAVSVPFIVSFPGRVDPGAVDTDHFVNGLDLFPTFCDYAGLPVPPGRHGASLRPLLEGKRPSWRDFAYTRNEFNGSGIVTDRYRYSFYREEDERPKQLFDLRDDPWEMRNLAADPEHADLVRALDKRLLAFEAGLNDRTPPGGWRGSRQHLRDAYRKVRRSYYRR